MLVHKTVGMYFHNCWLFFHQFLNNIIQHH
jgi:hypothetical protein